MAHKRKGAPQIWRMRGARSHRITSMGKQQLVYVLMVKKPLMIRRPAWRRMPGGGRQGAGCEKRQRPRGRRCRDRALGRVPGRWRGLAAVKRCAPPKHPDCE